MESDPKENEGFWISTSWSLIWAATATVTIAALSVLLWTSRQTRLALEARDVKLLGAHEPVIGAVLPPLHAEGGLGGRQTLALFVSETCGYCDEAWPAWETLVKDAGTVRVVVVNVTAPPTAAYASQHKLDRFVQLGRPDPTIQNAYRVGFTPQTIVLSAENVVVFARTGRLREQDVARLRVVLTGRAQ